MIGVGVVGVEVEVAACVGVVVVVVVVAAAEIVSKKNGSQCLLIGALTEVILCQHKAGPNQQ